ncbi:MAG: DsrE family protein [Pseudomonadota bacterium]
MRTQIRRSLTVLLTLAMVAFATVSAAADKTFFYNISTDESWASGMAMGQGIKAMEAGYDVVFFLNVRGVYLASTERQHEVFGPTGKTPPEMLRTALDEGARVVVCPMCLKKAGMTMDEVIKGAERGGPDVTFELMADDDTVVMSY